MSNKEPDVCHDCGCNEGEIHTLGCDMERCPFCGRQLISCDCCYEKLGFKVDMTMPYHGLPMDIFYNGLSEELHKKWLKILDDKGRVPYILYPMVCARCGKLWPDLFRVPNDEWEKYIRIDKRHEVLCKDCYGEIKHLIDAARR